MTDRLLRFPLAANIDPLRKALWQARITHIYSRTQQHHEIVLVNPARYADAVALGQRWFAQQGGEIAPAESAVSTSGSLASMTASLAAVPFTTSLIGLCLVVFALQKLIGWNVVQWLTYTPLDENGSSLGGLTATLVDGQWWRLVTPAFMHFDIVHLATNLTWLWFLGRQIERRLGGGRLGLFALVCLVASNLAQYLTTGPLMEGMSGLVYAYLGFIWLTSRWRPMLGYYLPTPLMGVMLAWLLLGYTPLMSLLRLPPMANQVHLTGLLVGLGMALIAYAWPCRRVAGGSNH